MVSKGLSTSSSLGTVLASSTCAQQIKISTNETLSLSLIIRIQKALNMCSHLILLQQKTIMPRIAVDDLQLRIGHPPNQLLLFPQRVQHVRIDPQNAYGNLHVRQHVLRRTAPSTPDIVRIHLFRQLDIRHRIETVQELPPLILQVALHLPRRLRPIARSALVRQRPPELLVISQRRPVAHHGNLPGHGESRVRRIAGVVPSPAPLGIGVDGLALRLADAYLPRRVLRAAGYGHGRAHEGFDAAVAFCDEFPDAVGSDGAAALLADEEGPGGGPGNQIIVVVVAVATVATVTVAAHGPIGAGHDAVFHHLHPPEAPPDHALDGIDLELVLEHQQLQSHRIPHANVRVVHPVNGPAGFVPRNVVVRRRRRRTGILLVVPRP
mmetsp:Transcript_17151/g.37226  ORF Transcript_17151/g.37226 Transcript_17151/m.37226 type:complete len:380 (-) Transcript_17151:928-2067(-)